MYKAIERVVFHGLVAAGLAGDLGDIGTELYCDFSRLMLC